ncbi:polyphosphate polymerase domain-containing protein [Maribellus sp. YY47]|uniref:polyphosphate polymerase domain-containing protein n=1 Tax=Maribellus sp. YY47 TaxID=2929486 RepID=UPI002000BFEE|nr:polyphosphate polymerase domain-containing protein [Maribellus sp. YY47]MCK3685867.1 polyphosphate polymerase domain-containing protein [Maribellus sp. YY47]
MNYDHEILTQTADDVSFADVLSEFEAISLDEMDQVKLMNRFDSKFCLTSEELNSIFEEIKNDYFVLEVEGIRSQQYNSIYYDTPDDQFYISHHNGRANRMKLRKREYTDSDIVFLEIKHKTNKGKTRKTRMEVNGLEPELSRAEKEYLKQHLPAGETELKAKFGTSFRRITLVSRNFDERCTIDTDLCFNSFGTSSSKCKDFAIIELKRDGQKSQTKLATVLKQRGIYQQNFSKYCIGRAMNEADLKRNQFKGTLMKMEKQFALV